jgi:hypothetical protein
MEKQLVEAGAGTNRDTGDGRRAFRAPINDVFINVYEPISDFVSPWLSSGFQWFKGCGCHSGSAVHPSRFTTSSFKALFTHYKRRGTKFYCINDYYPDYLLCQYDVDEKNYSQSDESGWFKAALKQIRHSGPKKFPPIKWIAIIINNRAEWNGASTFEKCYKAGAIFKASDVFDSSRKFSQLIADADMDRHPFKYDQLQPTPGDAQRW